MILFVDNYDSFVQNLARYFRRLGQETHVVRNDAITVAEVRRLEPQALVLSPGPGSPRDAGCSLELVRELHRELPILGVCLGHQVICEAFGGQTIRAPLPMHGRVSEILHDGSGLFEHIPSPMRVCRYHSLIVAEKSLPNELAITARSADGVPMALEHSNFPVWGVQFHPEATLTEWGYQLLANFLRLSGIACHENLEELTEMEFCHLAADSYSLPSRPVTF